MSLHHTMSHHHTVVLSDVAACAQWRGLRSSPQQGGDSGLRGALLLAQIDLLVDALLSGTTRDDAADAMAMSLIPLVDGYTRALALQQLKTCPGAPPAMLAALAPCLGATDAGDAFGYLDGHRLAGLVEEARHDPPLARRLLDRPEPTIQHRAALYRFAQADERAVILSALADRPHLTHPRVGSASSSARDIVHALPSAELPAIMAAAGFGPSPQAVQDDLADEAEAELFALGLLAIGVSPDDGIRALLAQPPALSHSVRIVHRLAGLLRSTPLAVARHVADPDDRIEGWLSGLRRDGAEAPAPASARRVRTAGTDRARPHREASVLPDRRSKATTGPRRT